MTVQTLDLESAQGVVNYLLKVRQAEDDLIAFAEFMMLNERFPDDANNTRYMTAAHHEFMADVMMQIERGEKLKVINNIPPRHGKSQLCTIYFAAWYHGRNPANDVIVATYSEKFAKDFGREIRAVLNSPRFRQVFPEYRITNQADDRLKNSVGGKIYFLGRRSPTTGRGGHLIIVDDPTKDDRDVKYDAFREDQWDWFTQTLLTRRHTDRAAIALTQTRWHEDDIVGRITDKTNPAYSSKFASGFEIINLPAIATGDGNDPLGRKEGEPLWPERFGIKYLEEMREANAVSFSALYQSDPTPADGVFYSPEELVEYQPSDLPKDLRMFVASDHAVATSQKSDRTVMLPYGVDKDNTAWIMPHIVWRVVDAQTAVEEMIDIIRVHRPAFWFAERGHITRAIGPFLQTRMREVGVHCPIIEDHPVADKTQRSQSARARCAQGKIRFPGFAPWWPKAKAEILKFPNGRFDDFCDALSIIGIKLMSHTMPSVSAKKSGPAPGTWGALKAQWKLDDQRAAAEDEAAGW